MALKTYHATGLTGGTQTSSDVYDLDSLSVSVLNDGDLALVSDTGGLYVLKFNATSTDATSSPNRIRPTDYVSMGVWELLTVNQAANTLSSGVLLTGGIMGLNYSRTGDDEVTVEAGNCMDSTNSVWMSLASSQAVSISSQIAAGAIIHLFLCSDGVVRVDTDITGATSLSAYTKRWIGFTKNNASGDLIQFLQDGDMFAWVDPDEAELGTITTSFAQLTLSSLLPESRISAIEYGARKISTNSGIYASDDGGTETSFFIAYASTTGSGLNAWGFHEYQKMAMKPYSADRYYQANLANTTLLVHAVKMKR